MKLLGRPLALACFFFVACAALGYFLSDIGGILSAVFAVLSCILLLLATVIKKRDKRVVFTCFLCALFSFLAFMSSHLYFGVKMSEIEEFYGREVYVEGYVDKCVFSRSYGGIYHITTEKIDEKPVKARLVLECDRATLSENDIFSMRVEIAPFSENINGYAERAVCMSDGYLALCVQAEEEYTVKGLGEKGLLSYASDARKWVTERFASVLDGRCAGLYSAAFAGDDSYVSDHDALALRRSGTTHVLAVSGMHFTVIMAAVLIFLTPMGLPLKARNTLLIIIALTYMAFTGFSASVVRSAIMLSLTYIAASIGKTRDMITSLSLTMTLMLLFSPYLILNASFLLSSSATLGIIVSFSVLTELFGFKHKKELSNILKDTEISFWRRLARYSSALIIRAFKGLPVYFASSVIVSMFAIAFSIPFSLVFFKSFSLVSLPCGLLLSPIASMVIVSAPIVLLLGGVLPLGGICSVLSGLFYTTAHFFSDIDGVYMNIDYLSVKLIIALMLCALFVLVVFSKNRKIPALLCALFIISVPVAALISENVEYNGVDAVYNSEGDSDMLCFRADRGIVMADMGSTTRTDIKAGIASAYSLRENTLSAYILTDVKPKHVSLMRYLCTNCNVRVLYMPRYASENKTVLTDAIEKEIAGLGVAVKYFSFGVDFSFDGVSACVSELEYKQNSGLPLYSVRMQREDREILWVSRSYFEGEKSLSSYGRGYDAVIFGSYGAQPAYGYSADIKALGAQRFHIPNEQYACDFSEGMLSDMRAKELAFSETAWFIFDTDGKKR